MLNDVSLKHVSLSVDGVDATTVVITTHYTEEAMQANRVGERV